LYKIWNWFKGLFSGGKIQSNIGKGNTSSSTDVSNDHINAKNGAVVGNTDTSITNNTNNFFYKSDDSDRIRLIKEFSKNFLVKADKIHREIGLSTGEQNIPNFDSELAALENSIDTAMDIPDKLILPAKKVVQSLWDYYKVVINSEDKNYSDNFEMSKQKVVVLARNYSDTLRKYIHSENS
jgi:hypothetical protein